MLVLERYCYSPTQGTFARLFLPDAELVTVEQPWRGNRPFESCVPEGIYGLVWVDSPRFGCTVALENRALRVFASIDDATEPDDRYACLLHSANTASQLQGCIAPGMREGVMGREWAVLESGLALQHLLDYIEREGINELHITSYHAQYP